MGEKIEKERRGALPIVVYKSRRLDAHWMDSRTHAHSAQLTHCATHDHKSVRSQHRCCTVTIMHAAKLLIHYTRQHVAYHT